MTDCSTNISYQKETRNTTVENSCGPDGQKPENFWRRVTEIEKEVRSKE